MIDYEAPLPGSICGEARCRGGVSGIYYVEAVLALMSVVVLNVEADESRFLNSWTRWLVQLSE